MTPLTRDHLAALRACLECVAALDCVVEFFGTDFIDKPVVRIAAPTAALLDHLDARQIRIGEVFGLKIAELEGCGVAWRASAHMRVDEGEHIDPES